MPPPLLQKLIAVCPEPVSTPLPVRVGFSGRDVPPSTLGTTYLLHLLLANRDVYKDADLIRQVLQVYRPAANKVNGLGVHPVMMALLSCAEGEASLLAEVASAAPPEILDACLAELRISVQELGAEKAAAAALHLLGNARRIFAEVRKSQPQTRTLLGMLEETPGIVQLFVDGEFLLWWAILFRADADFVLRLLAANRAAASTAETDSVAPLLLAVVQRYGEDV